MPGPDKSEPSDETPDLLDQRLLTLPDAQASSDLEQDDDDTAALPQITKLPEGISVVEQHIGQASGQWIFYVRCECGRRWFDTREITTAQCPRCGLWVQVKSDPRDSG
jgi:DNA-directed RNA polymerase subunit RPC12/RpoP